MLARANGHMPVATDGDDTMFNTTRDLRGDITKVERHLTPVIGVHRFFEEYPEGNWFISHAKNGSLRQEAKLDKFGLMKYFLPGRLQISSTEEIKKEKIEYVASQIDGPKVYVDDKLNFLATAKRAGFITIRMKLRIPPGAVGGYVHWEPRNADQVPDYTVKNWSEILALFQDSEALRT